MWLANDEIRAAHAELMGVLDLLVARAQEAGAVRSDVGAVDVLMMVKGVCEATQLLSARRPEIAMRQLDLVRAAISPREASVPARPPADDRGVRASQRRAGPPRTRRR